MALYNPVKFLRGVGPRRAAALEERGIATVADLLGYLPFRYEDRVRFTKIAEIVPGQVATVFGEVSAGGGNTVRFRGGFRPPVFHVTIARWLRAAPCAFFSRRLSGGEAQRRPALSDARQGRARSATSRSLGDGQSGNRARQCGRGRARRFDRSGPHRPGLRSDRRDQLAHAAADYLRRAAGFRWQRSRSAPCRDSRAVSLPRSPRSAPIFSLSSQGRERRAAQHVSQPRAGAADLRGIL